MKWLAYIGWFFGWFFLHSLLFVPALKGSTEPLLTGLIAIINFSLLIGGFYFISKYFSKPPAK